MAAESETEEEVNRFSMNRRQTELPLLWARGLFPGRRLAVGKVCPQSVELSLEAAGPAAVLMAIENAIGGAEINEYPATPDKILNALGKAKGGLVE